MNKRIDDPAKGKPVLINECSRTGLVNFPEIKEMYDVLYPEYQPDSIIVDSLKRLPADFRITIVLGTWCGDSKLQLPHFLKVVDALKVQEDQLTFLAVDGKKKTEGNHAEQLKIERVPTFIIYDKSKKEIGRIVESPMSTLEADMLSILKKQL